MDSVFMAHTSEWIISKGLELTWIVWAGNGCLAWFLNWHVSQTFDITSFILNLGRPLTRFCFYISLRRWRLTWPTHLCQISMSPTPFPCVNNVEFTRGMFTSKVNIRPFLSPFVINLPWLFMCSTKHPFGLNVNYKPCSTIWPTETKFFVMVGTWSTFLKYFVCPSCMDNDTLPICVMGCVVSSPVSTNHGVFKSFVSLNHSPWLVMWFEAPESTYQTLLSNTPPVIEFVMCCITNICSSPWFLIDT